MVAAVIAAATSTAWAFAHRVQYPKRHTQTVEPGVQRLESTFDVHGHDEGTQLRERFDVDHDGKLDQDEAQELGRHIAIEEHRTLVLLADGKPLAMIMTALSEDGLIGPVRVTEKQQLAAVWEGSLPAMPSKIRIADDENEGMRVVPLTVRVRGARVATAGAWEVGCDSATGTSRIEGARVTGKNPLELVLVPGAACGTADGS
jgi:hypothetical protein